MAVEESLSKTLYRIVLYSVKVIPIVISGIYLLNTVLSYFNIDLELFSYVVQFLFIGQMYATSYAFKFCACKIDYINSIVHESVHVKQAILEAYNVEDEGESPAYTMGYLVSKTYRIFNKLVEKS